MDIYAVCEQQDDLEKEFLANGLHASISMCRIPSWKKTFKQCTRIPCILNYEWTVVPPLIVHYWNENAAHCKEESESVEKIKSYLEISSKYNASLQFC